LRASSPSSKTKPCSSRTVRAHTQPNGRRPYCAANPTYLLQLDQRQNQNPSDATLDDLRNLRSKVSGALLAGGFDPAYYLSAHLGTAPARVQPSIRSSSFYENVNGQPKFDGWPVRWVGVAQPYLTTAAASTFITYFWRPFLLVSPASAALRALRSAGRSFRHG